MTNAQERKAQERQARRRRIQEAARTVFAERGYAGASIELIARAAQLSVGAIYLYFRSEEDAEGPRILRLLAQPAVRPQLSDEVVVAVQAGIGRIQDHIGACVADGIHAN